MDDREKYAKVCQDCSAFDNCMPTWKLKAIEAEKQWGTDHPCPHKPESR